MVVKPHGEADSRNSEIWCSCRPPLVRDNFENALDLVEAASERLLEDIRRQLQDGRAS